MIADQNYILLLLLLLLLVVVVVVVVVVLLENLNKKLPKKGDMINVMRYISREKKIVAFKNVIPWQYFKVHENIYFVKSLSSIC